MRARRRTATATTSHRLGDGCYHVFLDMGSNRGVHGRFLFEPEKYPNNLIGPIFDEAFGNMSRQKMPICVFAFEPNPVHIEKQRATEKAYRLMGWRYTFLNVGVSDKKKTCLSRALVGLSLRSARRKMQRVQFYVW